MSPDVLTAGIAPRVPRPPLAERQTALPVLLSALIAGAWAALAFARSHGTAAELLVALLAALCCGACFTAVIATAGRWPRDAAQVPALRRQLARCSFATVVLLVFFPEYVARLTPPLLRSLLLVAIIGLLWAALCLLVLRQQRRVSIMAVHAVAVTALLLLFIATTALAVRKYLVFGYVGQDLAYFAQILHTTLHGHLFWGNLLQDLIYSRPVATDFAGHNSPAMFLLLPFYALFPSPITLLVLRNLALLGCAIPIFLLARRRGSASAACLWAAAFLLTPAILYQTVFDFYPLSFVALPMLFTLYFYVGQRYAAFWIALAATLLVREDLVFFVFGLGLLALLERRPLRWSLPPLAVATLWAALSFFVVLPWGLHGATFVTDTCFSHLGRTPAQMIQGIVFHSRDTILVRDNIVYIKTLLTATGLVLAFGSLVALLSLPYLAINLLAGAGPCITTVIFAQYSVIPATLLFAGALLALTRRGRPGRLMRLGHLGQSSSSVPPLLLLAMCCASLVFVTGKPQFADYQRQSWNAEARTVLNLIPAGESVAAPRYMLPHLANRDCLYQTHRLLEYHAPVYQYLILDTDWSHINAAGNYRFEQTEVERRAAVDAALQIVYASPRYRVYRNATLGSRTCDPPATAGPHP